MIDFLKTAWEFFVQWGEEIYEHRRNNRFMGMY